MTYEVKARAIEQYLNSNWTLTPVGYENVPFTDTDQSFIELFIKDGRAFPASLGDEGQDRHTGVFFFRINVPKHTGMTQIRTIVDTLNSLFGRQVISGIRIDPPDLSGSSEYKEMYRQTVAFPFEWDE